MKARRAVFVANDGLGAGHVTRSIAILKALAARFEARGQALSAVLATTSEADALLRATGVTALRLPSPGASQRQGLPLSGHRRLLSEVLHGLFNGLSPELLVVDTFPAGPHLELSTLIERAPLRVLIQRSVAAEAVKSAEMTTARGLYNATISPADPTPLASPWRGVFSVEPVVLGWPRLPRGEARQRLGLAEGERAALINPGGGGDPDALRFAREAAAAVERLGYRAVLAEGPLSPGGAGPLCPLSPYLEAFDVAAAAAGYNSAHELAAAGLPALLWSQPRAFDDQRGRALRFERAGYAVAVGSVDEIEPGLARLAGLSFAPLAAGGAAQAAAKIDALLGEV